MPIVVGGSTLYRDPEADVCVCECVPDDVDEEPGPIGVCGCSCRRCSRSFVDMSGTGGGCSLAVSVVCVCSVWGVDMFMAALYGNGSGEMILDSGGGMAFSYATSVELVLRRRHQKNATTRMRAAPPTPPTTPPTIAPTLVFEELLEVVKGVVEIVVFLTSSANRANMAP